MRIDMGLLELSALGMLTVISLWLAYLNYKILKVSEQILIITNNLNQETINIRSLTQELVYNTGLPDDFSLPLDAPNSATAQLRI